MLGSTSVTSEREISSLDASSHWSSSMAAERFRTAQLDKGVKISNPALAQAQRLNDAELVAGSGPVRDNQFKLNVSTELLSLRFKPSASVGMSIPIGLKFHGDSVAIEVRFGLSACEFSFTCHGRSHCAVEVLHTRNHFFCHVNKLLVLAPGCGGFGASAAA